MSFIIFGNSFGVELCFCDFVMEFKMTATLTLKNVLVDLYCDFNCILWIPYVTVAVEVATWLRNNVLVKNPLAV